MPDPLVAKARALLAGGNRDMVRWFYDMLSILDSKASGLLRINSFVMTIISLFLAYARVSSGAGPKVSRGFMFACLVDFILLAASSVLCFFIIRVTWGVLEKVPSRGGEVAFDTEIDALATVTGHRTHLFWNAWWLGLAGFALAVCLALYGGFVLVSHE